MRLVSRALLLATLTALVGAAHAKVWTLGNGKTVEGEFKGSSNAVVYLDNGNKFPFHRLVEKEQKELRRKLVLKNDKDALADIGRPERGIRQFVNANGQTRMKGRLLGVSSSGAVLIEVGVDIYEFPLNQFSDKDATYIRREAAKVGDEGYLPTPKKREDAAGNPLSPQAGNARRPGLGAGPMTGEEGGAVEKGDGNPYASMPPSGDDNIQRSQEFNIRDYPNYPGGANNPFESGPPTSSPKGGFARGDFAPPPGSGPGIGSAAMGGTGAPAAGVPRTNDRQGLDGIEFGREEIPPIVVNEGDPGYEEMLAKEQAKRKQNQLFPGVEPPRTKRAPLFGGGSDEGPSPSDEAPASPKPFEGGDAWPEDSGEPADEELANADAPATTGNMSLAMGILIGAGGMMLMLGGLGVGLLLGKKK